MQFSHYEIPAGRLMLVECHRVLAYIKLEETSSVSWPNPQLKTGPPYSSLLTVLSDLVLDICKAGDFIISLGILETLFSSWGFSQFKFPFSDIESWFSLLYLPPEAFCPIILYAEGESGSVFFSYTFPLCHWRSARLQTSLFKSVPICCTLQVPNYLMAFHCIRSL